MVQENRTASEKGQEFKEQQLRENMKKIKYKLLVMSGKGGVGKSTLAVNLTYGLFVRGFRVGILDADLHGPSIPAMLGLEDSQLKVKDGKIEPFQVAEGFKVISTGCDKRKKDTAIIWRGPMKMGVIQQLLGDVNWGELDFLIVDSPPGTGDEPLSIAQLIPDINGVVIVTTPQEIALLDSRKSVNFANQLGIPIAGIIENMSGFVCPNCGTSSNLFSYGGGERAAEELNVPFLGRIPLDPEVVKGGDDGYPLLKDQDSGQTGEIVWGIVKQVISFVEGKK